MACRHDSGSFRIAAWPLLSRQVLFPFGFHLDRVQDDSASRSSRVSEHVTISMFQAESQHGFQFFLTLNLGGHFGVCIRASELEFQRQLCPAELERPARRACMSLLSCLAGYSGERKKSSDTDYLAAIYRELKSNASSPSSLCHFSSLCGHAMCLQTVLQ